MTVVVTGTPLTEPDDAPGGTSAAGTTPATGGSGRIPANVATWAYEWSDCGRAKTVAGVSQLGYQLG
ncbi:MAG: hypothetical protein F2840_09190 [Actinobacteria bacterium]|uniref:Unannotated protein n=1 Tax=freshwater metagenome TaxID=449393 RepID=A0A6J7KPV2_9ZZZZ|nr:hypothetical protein [Actinomycetota bacterium]